MNIELTKDFEKCLYKLKNKKIEQTLAAIIIQIEKVKSIQEINNLKKLKGYQHYYRIRMGDYRLGISIEENTVWLLYIGHRKDIYDEFP